MKKILVVDTETTGFDPNKNCLWQIGCYYRNEFGQLFSLNLKCKPYGDVDIEDEALKVAHMTRDELFSLPDPNEVYQQFRNFLISISAGEKPIWVGYNSRFDLNFVEAFMKHFDPKESIWNYFDRHFVDMLETTKFMKAIGVFNPENLKLGRVYEMFGMDTDTAHDALQDTKVTYMLFQYAEQIFLRYNANPI